MSSRQRRRVMGRKDSAPFLSIPKPVLDSPNFCKLSPIGAKMLLDIGRQYSGKNNGDLSATARLLRDRGWNSNATITKAIRELEHYGFIVRTRHGGRNRCSLFALTWRAIDECGGKLEMAPTVAAPAYWKEEQPAFHASNR